jgi:PAS domain S-box-containing protein
MTLVDQHTIAATPRPGPESWNDVVHSSRDIIYLLRPDGTYWDVNQQLTRVLRRPREQIVGASVRTHLDKEHAAIADRVLKGLVQRRTTERSTRVFQVPGADPQTYEIIETPLLRNGEVWAIAGVGRDISQETLLEHKLWDSVESQRYTLDFALRTSLGLVKGYVYTLGQSESLPDDRRIRYTRIIEEEIDRLAKIIEDILDFRRLEADAYEFNEEVVQLADCVNMVLLQFEEETHRRKIELAVNVPDHMDPLYLFPEAVQRVLANLVQNAIHHTMHSGKIAIEVLDSDLYVDIIVRDNGVGIPDDELPYIFDKFFKSKSSAGDSSQGIGMGLAITKILVSAMGGRIWAKSNPGTGNEFRVMLPRRLYSASTVEDVPLDVSLDAAMRVAPLS